MHGTGYMRLGININQHRYKLGSWEHKLL